MNYVLQKLLPVYHEFKIWAFRYPALYEVLKKWRHKIKFSYPPSRLAHRYLDGLSGVEIGASAFNPFGLETLNINCTLDDGTSYDYRSHEMAVAGHAINVDLVALGDQLPFADGTWDFVLTSHVIEHFYDPIKALCEWSRVVRPGGYVFLIVPHKERNPDDKPRPRTTVTELIARHAEGKTNTPSEQHYSAWQTDDFLELCAYLKFHVVDYQDRDDKVGNGFTVVIQKSA